MKNPRARAGARLALVLGLTWTVALGVLQTSTGQDWQATTGQTTIEEWTFYHPATGSAVLDSTLEIVAVIEGADTSSAANRFTFTWDTGQFWKLTGLPRSGFFDIWRRTGLDTLYRAGVFLHGGFSGKGAVDDTTVVDESLTGTDILNESIEAADIDTNAVTSSEISDGTITVLDIADNAIDSTKIAAGVIDASHIQDGTIVTADLADGTITGAKLSTTGSPSMTDFRASAGGPDTLRVDKLIVDDWADLPSTIIVNSGGSGTMRGGFTWDGTQLLLFEDNTTLDIESNTVTLTDDATDVVTINGDLVANDAVTLGNTVGDLTIITGDLDARDDMILGNNTSTDTLGVKARATFHDSVLVGYDFATAGADSQRTALHVDGGFIDLGTTGAIDATWPSSTSSKTFLFPGLTSDCRCWVNERESSGSTTSYFWARWEADGVVRVQGALDLSSSNAITIFCVRRTP